MSRSWPRPPCASTATTSSACRRGRAGAGVLAKLRDILDPQAGSAALLLQLLLSDTRIAGLNPILVTGRTVACSRSTAIDLGSWLEDEAPRLRGAMATDRLFEPNGG